MAREVTPPTDGQWGEEHPAFVMIGASRVSNTPGAVLFDSDIRHGQTVVIRLQTATRRRDVHNDFIHASKIVAEIELSEAQWASFVSSMNTGDGVPATARYLRDGKLEMIDGLPYDPRLAHSMKETHEAADKAFGDIRRAMAFYDQVLKEKAPAAVRKAALDSLQAVIRNATANVNFAGNMLVEHAENVVQKARADIEAIVTAKAAQYGLEANQVGPTLEIES